MYVSLTQSSRVFVGCVRSHMYSQLIPIPLIQIIKSLIISLWWHHVICRVDSESSSCQISQLCISVSCFAFCDTNLTLTACPLVPGPVCSQHCAFCNNKPMDLSSLHSEWFTGLTDRGRGVYHSSTPGGSSESINGEDAHGAGTVTLTVSECA